MSYALVVTSIDWVSHVLLDSMGGLTPIIWPLSNYSYGLAFELELNMKSFSTLILNAELMRTPYDYGLFKEFDAPISTAEGLASSLINPM